MSITAKFRINQDRVIVEIPEKNLFLNKPNVVFFDSQSNGILGVGESEEATRSNVLKQETDFPNHLMFGKSFQYNDEKSGLFDLMVVEFYLAALYYSKQIWPIAIESVDFDFQIEDYDKWDEKRKLLFEFSLQNNQKGRALKINAKSREILIGKRRAERLLRLFLMTILPLATLYFGIEYSSSMFGFVLAFVGLYASIFAGVILWVLITSKLLPKPYIAFIIPELPFRSWTQKIAECLLNIYGQE